MISYSLNSDGIFYVTFSETVTTEHIKNYLSEFEQLDYLPGKLLALYDLRNAALKIESKDVSVISDITNKSTRNFHTVRTAFLVEKPNVTAYSILFSEEHVPKKTKREVFSTKEAALDWLKSYM